MKSIKNTHLDLKLHEINNIKLKETHAIELGMNIPENYFSKSKIQILNRIKEDKHTPIILFYKKRNNWMLAASVLFLIGLSFYSIYGYFGIKNKPLTNKQPVVLENNTSKQVLAIDPEFSNESTKKIFETKRIVSKPKPIIDEMKEAIKLDGIKNNLLVETLFLEENQLNEYVTNYMLEDI